MKRLETHKPPTVIRFGRFGDMIMLTALTASLHHRYGVPCQVIGAGPWNQPIYQAHPDVARVWSFARHFPFPFSVAWPRVLAALHRAGPAPIFVCEHRDRQLVRIRRLLHTGGVDRSRCLFITDEPERAGEHWVDRLVRFGEQAAPPVPRSAIAASAQQRWAPRLHVQDSERAARDAWIRASGWSQRDLVLIQAGNFRSAGGDRGDTDDKSWPAEQWGTLFRRIHQQMPRALIILCGAPGEVPMLQRLQAHAGLDCVAVAGLPARQLFALCESAHSMISVDTGPAHAAAALGAPLVVMYGAESPAQWLPRSGSGSPVVGLGGPPASARVDQIEVDAVFDAWRSLAPRDHVRASMNPAVPGPGEAAPASARQA